MKARHVVIGALAVAAAAQLVPVERTNPPGGTVVDAPPAVSAVLRRACWDCHTGETVWGWHTRIAPISWLVAHDVNEGREHLDFSHWEAVGARRLEKLRRKLPEEVGEGEMPPRLYTLAHPAARLSAADRATLEGWGRTVALAPGAPAVDAAALEEDGDRHGRRRGRGDDH